MNLSKLIDNLSKDKIINLFLDLDFEISSIEINSSLVKNNSIFFALPATKKTKDGSVYINDAIKNGAKLIVTNQNLSELSVNYIQTEHVFELLTDSIRIFYHDLPKNIYAVTGTNGKSSVAEFTRQILGILNIKAASIGTLGLVCDHIKDAAKTNLTTPDIVTFYKNLSLLRKNMIDDVIIEASSIGLEQGRVANVNFKAGAFTNFTQDHLDYHETMEEYFNSKMILFGKILKEKSHAILNADIEQFKRIKEICIKKNLQIFDYGKNAESFKIEEIDIDTKQFVKIKFRGDEFNFISNSICEFQIYNILCALAIVVSGHNLNNTQIGKLLEKIQNIEQAPGRMQLVGTLKNKAQIYIDFAHSPDALENILVNARKVAKNKLLILFGCGGNRDAKKRSIMGNIACKYADLAIITDDNPRFEDASEIRKQIINGCFEQGKNFIEVENRANAISKSISLLNENDVLILAGKGHEKYQIIGDKYFDFDEEVIVKNEIKRSGK